jgi:hypothetical protein
MKRSYWLSWAILLTLVLTGIGRELVYDDGEVDFGIYLIGGIETALVFENPFLSTFKVEKVKIYLMGEMGSNFGCVVYEGTSAGPGRERMRKILRLSSPSSYKWREINFSTEVGNWLRGDKFYISFIAYDGITLGMERSTILPFIYQRLPFDSTWRNVSDILRGIPMIRVEVLKDISVEERSWGKIKEMFK